MFYRRKPLKFKSAWKKAAAYALCFAAAALAFVYWLFPADLIRDAIASRAEKIAPGVETRVEKIAPALPAGIRLKQAGLYLDGGELIYFDHLKVTARIFSLMGSRRRFDFTGALYDGGLFGEISFQENGPGKETRLDCRFSGVNAARHAAVRRMSWNPGLHPLNGRLSFRKKPGDPGRAALFLTDVRINFPQAVFGIERAAFSAIEAEAVLKTDGATIAKCVMKGNQAEIEISGSVLYGRDIRTSALRLNGVFRIKDAWKEDGGLAGLLAGGLFGDGGVRFRVRGTLANPRFSLAE
ncbi:putative Type II secretion system protein GspN [Candidatus Desulfarcum epimagneticum]|uniref:Putative Type II secretion system protein GspN n=1 Tax=uncultured Desulfobacteraceae bacterium TaxID=218296 RepID=A0A484HDF6_9BACT|nr:putative Type II secretion system protein GspN [uncultured Desulfobacteraceae bacterium]